MDVQVLRPVLEGVVTLVLALAGVAIGKYLQKLGIQVDAQKFFQQREVAQAVVLLVEEQFAARKKLAGSPAPPVGAGAEPGPTKQQAAVSELLKRLPTLSVDEARSLLDEAVIRAGLGATVGGAK